MNILKALNSLKCIINIKNLDFFVFFGPTYGEGDPPVGPKEQVFPFFLLKAPITGSRDVGAMTV